MKNKKIMRKRKNKFLKNKKMEQIQNGEIRKKMLEKSETEEERENEAQTFVVREYKQRYARITAYQLGENATIHCADGRKLIGNAGDYYVCLDQVQEFILPADIFKKMFIIKLEN